MRSTRRLGAIAVAAAALPALALLASERWFFGDLRGFPLDDAWIHLTLARNLSAGEGLAYQAGHLVAATTAPLWTALLALLSILPGDLAVWSKVAAFGAQVALLQQAWRLGRRLGLGPRRAALAVAAIGATDWLVFAVGMGMEVGLATALVLAGLARQIDERREPDSPPLAYLLFALAALTRPEALLLLPLALCDRALIARGQSATSSFGRRDMAGALIGLAVAATLLLPVGFAFARMSGSPLPTTLAAKLPGAPAWIPRLGDLRTVLDLMFGSQPLATLLAAGGALALARRRGGARDAGLLLPLWCLSLPLAASALTPPGAHLAAGNFGRYFFPLLPCVVLLGFVALDPLVPSAGTPRARKLLLLAAAIAALVGWPLARTARIVPLYLQARANVEQSDVAAARWCVERTARDARIAAVDVGALAYLAPNPLLDLGGVTDPDLMRHLARQKRERGLDWQSALASWIEQERPDFVLLYPDWYPLLERQPTRFPALARFRIRDNIAMAGSELVVYSTPWTRKEALR